MEYTLASLSNGQSGVVSSINDNGAMFERLCDLGFTKGSIVTRLFASPFGDPCAYRVKNTVIALRRSDARKVACTPAGGDA